MLSRITLLASLSLLPVVAFGLGPFEETDIDWNATTSFHKQTVLTGINLVVAKNPKCADRIDTHSTDIDIGKGNPDNPVFVVLCGEAGHESKIFFSKLDVEEATAAAAKEGH